MICGAGLRCRSRWSIGGGGPRDGTRSSRRPAEFLTASASPRPRTSCRRASGQGRRGRPVDARTYVGLVMTHNFLRRQGLRPARCSPRRRRFLAMLGPAVRTERSGRASSATRRRHLGCTTVRGSGVPPGSTRAEGAEEIAAADRAEIVAVKRGRGAGFLRDRRGRSTSGSAAVTAGAGALGVRSARTGGPPGGRWGGGIENEFDVPAPVDSCHGRIRPGRRARRPCMPGASSPRSSTTTPGRGRST
jgi:hypothetical protein